MAVFKVPRITTLQRLPILLDEGEIVFDTDLKAFFGGDGVTIGGKQICYCDSLPPTTFDSLLTESGDLLMTENGDVIILEMSPSDAPLMTTESGDVVTTEAGEILTT